MPKANNNKALKAPPDTAKVNFLNRVSRSYIQTCIDSASHYPLIAKSISEKLRYPAGIADALLNVSISYNNKGNYAAELENALNALQLYDSLKSTSSVADTYTQLAYIYKAMASQNRTATFINIGIAYSKISYSKYNSINDTIGMVNSLNASGILYRDKYYAEKDPKYYDTAFNNYTTALELINLSGKGKKELGKLFNNISQVYIEHKKDYQQGLSFLFKAVKFNEDENNRLSLSYNYGNMANAYVQLHDYKNALKYANEMLVISREIQQPNRIHDALYELYQVYRASGKPTEALYYYIAADKLTDSLTNIEKSEQVSELRAKYETQKKELEIQHLNIEKSSSNKKIGILASALGLCIILAVCMILLYRRVQYQNKKINLQSKRLEVMMKELHHRVKNNLQIVSSLLSLQTYKLDDEKTISVLKESQQRVQAMSLIHQRLYKTEDLTAVNMKEYITDLAESLLSSYGYDKDNFDLYINIEKEMLNIDKALPIGLIINEMVTNAMKYAYANIDFPVLEISLEDKGENLILSVNDNGKGIDEQLWKQKGSSFGKQLITALSKQLRAQQRLNVSNGTQFTLIIPGSKAA